MIDFNEEKLIRLHDAARLCGPGRHGGPVHLATIWRWILTGAKAPSGNRVRLEAVRVGGAWKTTAEALQRFFVQLTPDLDGDRPALPRSPSARQRASARASKLLDKIGI